MLLRYLKKIFYNSVAELRIEEKYNGWFVGYVETKSNVYFFATNVIPTDGLNVDDFISSRINVTKNALKQMNIMK